MKKILTLATAALLTFASCDSKLDIETYRVPGLYIPYGIGILCGRSDSYLGLGHIDLKVEIIEVAADEITVARSGYFERQNVRPADFESLIHIYIQIDGIPLLSGRDG